MVRWSLFLAFVCVSVWSGCGCQRREIPSGPHPDVALDPDMDGVESDTDGGEPDITVDSPPPDSGDPGDDEVEPEPPCPPDGPVGAPCVTVGDCGAGFECLTELSQDWEGEAYTAWPGGYCVDASWAAGCSPDDPATCPEGSRCIHLGLALCEDRWACMDACAPTDPAGVPYAFNACCRPGYRCDAALGACVPGCSNDRECCEAWSDEDGDGLRDEGEVTRVDGCGRACDDAMYACSGPGAGTFASACAIDADCPDDAACLREGCTTPFGGPFTGGLCIRTRCDLEGAGCDDGAGACVDAGTAGDPMPVCLAACTTGLEPGDPSSPCRGAYSCMPACEGDWVGPAPPGGEDGYCWPAVVSSAPPGDMFEPCGSDGECPSPLGLGACLETAGARRCSAWCNESLAREAEVCGPPSAPGDVPPGACWSCRCWRSCDDPGGPLSADPCLAGALLACYPVLVLPGAISWSADGSPPVGLCLPACASDLDCVALWGMPLVCDTVSGTCA